MPDIVVTDPDAKREEAASAESEEDVAAVSNGTAALARSTSPVAGLKERD